MTPIPGAEILGYQFRFLHRLPAPWRLRIRFGQSEVDVTSAPRPRAWGSVELLYVLAAVMLGRLTPSQVERGAAKRGRISEDDRLAWDAISAGLVGIDPSMVDGTVGEALQQARGELLGAWSGADVVGITEVEHGRARREAEEAAAGSLPVVRTGKRRKVATVPPVPGSGPGS